MKQEKQMQRLRTQVEDLKIEQRHKCPNCLDQIIFDRDNGRFLVFYCGNCATIVKMPNGDDE